MSRLILLGEAQTKRTAYFAKAAQALGVEPQFYPLERFVPNEVEPSLVKIDPYSYVSWEIDQMAEYLAVYQQMLKRLGQSSHHFYNEPEAILTALDKRLCKKILMKAGIPVTEMLSEMVNHPEQLREQMAASHWPGVFVKPRYGSAATGVLAYRFDPRSGRQVLYTCAELNQGRLINTKRTHRLEATAAVDAMLAGILSGETVVERWYPKAKHQQRSYDLRVVVQFGQVDFMVARTSKGPITNLQLNNGAVSVSQLGLSAKVLKEIEVISQQTLAAIPGLRYAGIDLLLTEGQLKPYVIEVNGQGDLMYQDIYAENKIYTRQIEYYRDHYEKEAMEDGLGRNTL